MASENNSDIVEQYMDQDEGLFISSNPKKRKLLEKNRDIKVRKLLELKREKNIIKIKLDNLKLKIEDLNDQKKELELKFDIIEEEMSDSIKESGFPKEALGIDLEDFREKYSGNNNYIYYFSIKNVLENKNFF